MDEGVVCSSCLRRMTVREMQQVVHADQLHGVFHF